MEILLAKSAGFCFGVQRAVDTAYKHADEKNASHRSDNRADYRQAVKKASRKRAMTVWTDNSQ